MYSTIRSLTSLQPGVILVEHLAGESRVEPLLGAFRPRHGEQPLEVAADHRRLRRALTHPLEPAELLSACSRTASGIPASAIFARSSSTTDPVVLTELLADRLDLLAEDVLALLLLDALVDVVADALAQPHQRQTLALELESELEPLTHVDGLEEPHLLLEGQIRRVAGRVGERPGLDDRAHERSNSPVVAAQIQDLLDDGAVLGLQLPHLDRGRRLVGSLLDLDEQSTLRIGFSGSGDATVQPVERDGDAATRQAHAIGDLGDRSDLCVLAVALRDEQHALLVIR